MLLVIDIGNSNIVFGVYEKDELTQHWRVATDRNKTDDEYGMIVLTLFSSVGLTLAQIRGVIISSVVPPLNSSFERMCLKYFHKKPLLIGPGIKTGLNIKADFPREIGSDRIVNAVAAIHYYGDGTPLIVVDLGTATTISYIDEKCQYWGGAIAPGLNVSMEALASRAAKLPRIELAKPASVIGRNTIASMQAGIFYGYVGQVDGLVRRMMAEQKVKAKVVATGGLAPLIADETETIDVVDSFLILKGLKLIYERNHA